MGSRPLLKHRILQWLFVYAVLLSAAVLAGGYIIHERVEHLAWESLLRSELDFYGQRTHANAAYRWRDTDTLRMFGVPGTPPLPADLASLEAGLHDDMTLDGVTSVVLVDQIDGKPVAMALNLTEFEGVEGAITAAVAAGTVVVILILGLVVMWRLGLVIQPLAMLAQQVEKLKPAQADQKVVLDEDASAEMVVIADAFNDYLRRNQSFVEREHAFIASSSHELRTPIAVIAGASELVLDQADVPPAARNQVARIHRTARNVEQLISLLLTLAKDPSRLADSSDHVPLDQLLPEIVEDHRHLTRDKDLTLVLEAMPPCEIVAPVTIVQAAIGNLLRNAIENSDRGQIRISLRPDATVVIEDPGHGMSPEEISEIYARVARGGGRDGGGIGLDLISRLCEHLGWNLAFSSVSGRGTRTTLRLRP
ncbi:sensor histidine kinase [Pseudoxanthomonas sacheonensis]|uniref:sensor histidine kinase n=1 Tax=Pseudoxanthomonas sacheonensis TaxID=443615 RepID=UPI0013D04B91|nr:HAMP domain-containing sensor histidine kinase [Pseudoxanthomonas sacheonensis]KAF1709616.1 two-component sensor histidine kinase [Pseudoxanthomonas sacheonensis]